MFTEALFTMAWIWKQPKCPSTKERIKKTWYVYLIEYSVQFSCSVVSNSLRPKDCSTQAFLPITNSQSLPKIMSIELVMLSNHLIVSSCLQSFPALGSFKMEYYSAIKRNEIGLFGEMLMDLASVI